MRIKLFLILGIFVPMLSLALARTPVARAFTFDYTVERTNEATGETYNEACQSEDIGNMLNQLRSGYGESMKELAKEKLVETLETYLPQIIICLASNLQAGGFGISGALDCAQDVGGEAAAAAQEQYLDGIEDDFINNCTSSEDMNRSMMDSRRILAENGRDGGPAFIEDYQAFMAQSRNRGRKIALNQMANTDYCPWIQAPMQGMFGFSAADAVNPANTSRDGGATYMDTAGCNAPVGYNPFDPKWQTAEGLAILMQPQNNIWGAYLMAEENMGQQIADVEKQDENEFVNSGGVGALRVTDQETGTSCRLYTPDGSTCLEYSTIKQPAAGTQAEIQAQRQALYDKLTNGTAPIQEMRAQIITSLLDATTPPVEAEYQLGPGASNISQGNSAGGVPRSGGGGGGDGGGGGGPTPRPEPTCAYARVEGCACTDTDQQMQAMATGPVKQATDAAVLQQIGISVMEDQYGKRVIPGLQRIFLDAVCHAGVFSGGTPECRLNGSSTTEILISIGPKDLVITVLNLEGFILRPGTVVAACNPGVL